VPFSVDPALIGSPLPAGAYDAFSSGLNGTLLSGQLLSIDLVYADGILARALGATSIDVGLALSTNTTFNCQEFPGFGTQCGNWPGFPTGVTGYLLAPDGSALTPPRAGGSAQGSDGSMFAGFTGVTSPTPGGANWELSGAHLEFGLPNTGFELTDALLRLVVRSGTVQFGTAQQLPDGDSLVPIASLGVIGALLCARLAVLLQR
jgi:hypothetical protein